MPIVGKEAQALPLRHYLSGGLEDAPKLLKSRILIVPPWQREYVWKASDQGEVGQLLEDLRDFVESSDSEYFMGPILFCKAENDDLLLIDGQQRTLTFTIVIMAVLRYIQNADPSFRNTADPLEDDTMTSMRRCITASSAGDFVRRVSMPQGHANEMLQILYFWTLQPEGEEADAFIAEKENWTQTQKNLLEVAVWIYEKKLKTQSWISDASLLYSMSKILSGVKFLELIFDNQQEAIAVFDRINSRGSSLDSGDLIKNRIFQAVGDEAAFNDISSQWIEMSKSLAGCSLPRMREPKFLLRALALKEQQLVEHGAAGGENEDVPWSVSAPKITYEKLTKFWGDRLRAGSRPPLEPLKFVGHLTQAAGWLEQVSREEVPPPWKKQGAAGMPKIDLRVLYFSRYLQSVQHYPVLLAGSEFKDFKVFHHLARQVHCRTAFYLLSEERTQDFEALVPLWTALLASLGPNASIADLDEIYSQHVRVSEERINALLQLVRGWSYLKGSEKNKLRAVLSELSRFVDSEADCEDKDSPISYFSTKKDSNGEAWDLDHILPKKSKPRDPLINSIGNLVLLKAKHNELKGAAQPRDKADVYRGSHLVLTQSLVEVVIDVQSVKVDALFNKVGFVGKEFNLELWDEEQIKTRADLYCALLGHRLRTP